MFSCININSIVYNINITSFLLIFDISISTSNGFKVCLRPPNEFEVRSNKNL